MRRRRRGHGGDVDVAMVWRMRRRRCGHGLENEETLMWPWTGE
jgi:hypothetical protein